MQIPLTGMTVTADGEEHIASAVHGNAPAGAVDLNQVAATIPFTRFRYGRVREWSCMGCSCMCASAVCYVCGVLPFVRVRLLMPFFTGALPILWLLKLCAMDDCGMV